MSELTLDQTLTKLSYQLVRQKPFYGEVLIRLSRALPKETLPFPAAATINRIYYNPQRMEEFSIGERNFVFLHELMHIMLQHVSRGQGKDTFLWNLAADIVVNTTLNRLISDFTQSGIPLQTPEGVVMGEWIPNAEDLTTYEIYQLLLEQNQDRDTSRDPLGGEGYSGSSEEEDPSEGGEQGNENSLNSGKAGSQAQPDIQGAGKFKADFSMSRDLLPSGLDQSNATKDQAEVQRILEEAEMLVQSIGTEAGSFARELESLKGNRVPWYRYIRRYLDSRLSEEESYDTPNKNFLWSGNIVPGPVEEDDGNLENVIIALDTSGSVFYDEKLLQEFFYQVKSLMLDYEMSGRIILWDVEVQADEPLNTKSDFKRILREVNGGGGTSLVSPLKYIRHKYGSKYKCLIILTDGFFNDPGIHLRDTLVCVPEKYGSTEGAKKVGRLVGIPNER